MRNEIAVALEFNPLHLYDPRRSANRFAYLWAALLLPALALAIFGISVSIYGFFAGVPDVIINTVGRYGGLVWASIFLLATLRRFQGLRMSKWFLLLMFVPLENVIFFIMLLFKGRDDA